MEALLETWLALLDASPVKLSKQAKRQAQKEAAEEFFRQRNCPPTQFRLAPWAPQPLEPEAKQTAQQQPDDLPKPGSMLNIKDSKEILARLASGEIKQVRRR